MSNDTPPESSSQPAPTPTPAPAPAAAPPFDALFTLLTNTTTGSTVHPTVQYLFADDDTSVLSAPPPRALVVDLAPSPDGTRWSVAWASSLSPDFALTSCRTAVQHDDDDKSPVLRLEGVEREPVQPASLPGEASSALADEFRRRIAVLGKVVAEGGKRRQLAGRGDEQPPA
ncbi:hypothetical protein UVI_02057450 [Ustilaginoidea virens]|nr:hypothetical protein UVI_02057450 [Ustilaginoidea virens]